MISDLVIFLSYTAIATALIVVFYKQHKRYPLEHKPLLLLGLFGVFILLCGFTHLVSVFIFWNPEYGFQAFVKGITALVSALTAVYMVPVLPSLLNLASPTLLQEKNEELKRVIAERDMAQEELAMVNRDLRQRLEIGQFDLQDREARIQVLIDTVVDGVILMDSKGVVLAFNPACTALFGYAATEVLGKNVKMLMPSPYQEEHDGYLEHYLDTGEQRIIGIGREVTGRRKDGSVFPMELSVGEVKQDNDSMFVGIIRDISDRKATEQSLRDAKHRAEQANKAKSMFLANMSHELRTPMNAVLGYSELVASDPEFPPRHRRSMEGIQNAAQHLMSLIEEILNLEQIEAGALTIKPQDFDISGMVRELTDVFSMRCVQKGLDWKIELDVQDDHVRGDHGKLLQVLINLLGNAVKFTEVGAVTLSVKQEKDRYRFDVQDTGPGISEEERSLLFVPFQQGVSGQKAGGTGLGLALCQRILNLMDSKMHVSSTPGEGSLFSFALKLQQQEITEQGSQEAEQPPALGDYRLPQDCNISALVVDDAQDNLDILRQMLETMGVSVIDCQNPLNAMKLLEQNPVNIAMLDLHMPQMTGIELMGRIRESYPGIVCVVVTASPGKDEEGISLEEHGFDKVLAKPFKFHELSDVMVQTLGIKLVRNDDVAEKAGSAQVVRLPELPAELREGLLSAARRNRLTDLVSLCEELAELEGMEIWHKRLSALLDRTDTRGIVRLLEEEGKAS
jgi:PAS domain S-box-containing protein